MRYGAEPSDTEGLEGLEGTRETAHIERQGGEKRNERSSYREGGERIEARCGWNFKVLGRNKNSCPCLPG